MTELPRPLKHIGLSLSGGGYRATAFHLGVLDLLERLELLDRVKLLSTVSGGTILGAAWAISRAQGEAHAKFRERMLRFLKRVNVMERALELFAARQRDRRPPSLIQCAANVYDQELFGGKRFGDLPEAKSGPFEELVFNATEFRTGVAFRLLRSASTGARFGHGRASVKRAMADQVRLADAVAASSCFPGAFEPLWFPDDFGWPEGAEAAAVRKRSLRPGQPALPLMDGGIYENQGIESLQVADRRVGRRIGLLLLSDTSQREANLLGSRQQAGRGRVSIGMWAVLAVALLLACLATLGVLAVQFVAGWSAAGSLAAFASSWTWPEALVRGMALVLSAAVASGLLALGWLLWRFRIVNVDGAQFPLWRVLKGLTLSGLSGLVRARLASVLAMTASVFMKRVRGMTLRNVAGRNHRKLVFNVIYELNLKHPKLLERALWLKPSDGLKVLASEAEAVGTKLWLTEAELDALVACGQATACFNLLRFLLPRVARPGAMVPETENDPTQPASPVSPPPEQAMFDRARAVWERLQRDPRCLLRDEPEQAPDGVAAKAQGIA